MNQTVPSPLTTTSLGEFSGSPPQPSTTVSAAPVARSTRLMRAGDERVPCSHTSSRPSGCRAMPLAVLASARSTDTSPDASDSRLIATSGAGTDVKYRASSSGT